MAAQPTAGTNDRVRRTQQERTEATRNRLMDAAGEVLLEVGYARTTIRAITERAGVSQGAHFHHFATVDEVVIAAAERLAVRQADDSRRLAGRLPEGPKRIDKVIDVMWDGYKEPFFAVWAELSLAARTDLDFRARFLTVEKALREIFEQLHRDLLGEELLKHPRYAEARTIIACFLQGLAMQLVIVPSPGRRKRADREPEYLKDVIHLLFDSEHAGASEPGSTA